MVTTEKKCALAELLLSDVATKMTDQIHQKTSGLVYIDATNIVQKSVAKGRPVIVVTINYRLLPNAGLLQSGREKDEDEDNTQWGLYDQKIALEWVRKHIHNFGGNPNEITLMGHSGGGDARSSKSGFHMLTRPRKSNNNSKKTTVATSSPYLEDEFLFKRAIIHSEGRSATATLNKNGNQGKRLAAAVTPTARETNTSTRSSADAGVASAANMQESHLPLLMDQLSPWTTTNHSSISQTGRVNFDDAEEGSSVGFSFMSDACLPHMTEQEKQQGYRVIDQWIDFAWGVEGERADA